MKKKKLQSIPKLKKSVQALANRYARLRDCFGSDGAFCISCGIWFPLEGLDGGHYRPTTHSATRFREDNIWAQCHKCNRFLHGNLTGYFRGLEAKIGRPALDRLDAIPRDHTWTRDELEELKVYYKEKINAIERGEDPTSDTGLGLSDMFKDQ